MTAASQPDAGAWQIEHQCPQCGAPVALEETDRLLTCPFCRTRVYISAPGCPRYCLPPHAELAHEVFYVPYWRLRGLVFAPTGAGIDFRHVDVSMRAAGEDPLPRTLGVRPQALKLRYAQAATPGRFVPSRLAMADLIETITGSGAGGLAPLFIGEQISTIYAPVYRDGRALCDAVLRRPFPGTVSAEAAPAYLEAATASPEGPLLFVGTLCPDCGWTLEGERDALVLFCRNCFSAWSCAEASLERVPFAILPSRGGEVTYLPFWRMEARIDGLPLETEADLIALANLPRVPTAAAAQRPCAFWCPAFKINPAVFLRWLRQLTAAQPEVGAGEPPRSVSLQTVNLGLSEALESIRVALWSLVAGKHGCDRLLPGVTIGLRQALLVYHPFVVAKSELVHETLRLAIARTALAFGANI